MLIFMIISVLATITGDLTPGEESGKVNRANKVNWVNWKPIKRGFIHINYSSSI